MYLEAPNYLKLNEYKRTSVFLAGTITGAPDWQTDVAKQLDSNGLLVFNPRRADFDVNDPTQEKIQIEWEYDHLKIADIILFWFCKETVGPITLFELGKHMYRNIYVGIEEGYPREADVRIQMSLAEQSDKLAYNKEDLIAKVKQEAYWKIQGKN